MDTSPDRDLPFEPNVADEPQSRIDGFDEKIPFPGVEATGEVEQTRRTVKVTRMLQVLRGHEMSAKIPKTYRNQVTDSGPAKITALLAAGAADTKKLLQTALIRRNFACGAQY